MAEATYQQSHNAIGIFDSGIGGLTVAQAIRDALPQEDIIYYGDTAHLPYGNKSQATIQSYCQYICDILLKKNCKCIVIACNSASAAAGQILKEHIADRALLINVIDPVVHHIAHDSPHSKVGIIGTAQTIDSATYRNSITQLNPAITISSLATPLLASAIEEDFTEQASMQHVLKDYLSHPTLQHIEALLLGCTHYPLIEQQLQHYYHNTIDIINPTGLIAAWVKQSLTKNNLLNNQQHGSMHFYVSDYTQSFARNAQRFFGSQINLEAWHW